MSISRPYGHMQAISSSKSVPGAHLIGGESVRKSVSVHQDKNRGSAILFTQNVAASRVRPLAFHAKWKPTFNISRRRRSPEWY